MLKRVFGRPEKHRIYIRQLFREIDSLGVNSVWIVIIISLFIGGIMTIQFAYSMSNPIYPRTLVGLGTRDTLILEFSSTMIALIMAGKIGSNITSEIGTMRVTEQIDAMEVSGTNPFKYLVVTRVLATTLMLPVLVIFGDAIALYGSYLIENLKGEVSFVLYFNKVFNALEFGDIIPATIKTFFFGYAIGIVGCFKGYYCTKGTSGVGIAANSAVVFSSLLVFIIDFIAVFVTDIFFEI